MVANENDEAATFGGNNMLSADQGPNNGLISEDFAGARKEKLGGRKMMVDDHVSRKENKEVKLNPVVANSRISGANHSVGKYDEEGKKWELSTKLSERVHFVAFSADYRRTNTASSSTIEGLPKRAYLDDQKDNNIEEFRRSLDEEFHRIVNLIHKDYRGMNHPRRKPPINNHEPVEEDADDTEP
ncbi:hypothetical protein Scep_022185 [Stephania cephalantha]|uniref:Uncharacterized protein n=1 Tax=Stephania cephalantha TaxID=152367 RepID=A0AAP0F5W7_9MAGN